MSYKVGLTGGIGAGKTAVSDEFARLRINVIDTDQIARQLVAPGQPALTSIVDRFGDVLDPTGKLDRGKLRKLVFDDPEKRRQLEAILHPAIRQETLEQSQRSTSDYCVIVVPLMFETGFNELVDRVLVVDIPEAEQLLRVMARDRLDRATVNNIMAAQLDRPTRLARADDVLDNTVSAEERDRRVQQLHQQYLELARSRKRTR